MSFSVACANCGAPSGPSTGVCPFCKSVAPPKQSPESRNLLAVTRYYDAGDLPQALSLCATLAAEDEKVLKNSDFLLQYSKILLESEGPSSRIKSLLGKAYALPDYSPEVVEYLEIVEARSMLSKGLRDEGEKRLSLVLRRSPNNIHALFLLGAHLFWSSGDLNSSARHLEKCVNLSPKFLRAWGCLGAIYEKMENPGLALRAFRKCQEIETEPNMQAFFKEKVSELAQ